jgi:hypothetical protein
MRPASRFKFAECPGYDRSAATDRHRRFRILQDPYRFRNGVRIRTGGLGRVAAVPLFGPDFRWIRFRFLGVERQCQMHCTWAAGCHRAERLPDHRRQPRCVVQRGIPLGHRAEQRRLVELGQRIAAARGGGDIAGDRQQRNGTLIGLDDTGQHIGRPASRRAFADAGLAGDAGIAVRHVGGMALVPGEKMPDPVVLARKHVIKRQAGIAAQAEHVGHLADLQHPHQSFGANQLVCRLSHQRLPCS